METDHGFVPDDLVFLVDFTNSTYPGTVDQLGSTDLFEAWLADHGRPASVTAAQRATAQALRDGLREAAVHNAGVVADQGVIARGEQALAGLPVHAALREGAASLVPSGTGVDRALGEMAVALASARLTGRWARVKACTGEDCGFVFWDGSRNGSRRWCDMQRCGSRQKMRNYRARTSTGRPGIPVRAAARARGREGPAGAARAPAPAAGRAPGGG